MKIGIIQGRLSKPINGHIQEFPSTDWKNEFNLLEEIDLNHIEWIITKSSYDNNPIFFENLFNFKISSICCDHIIDENIIDYDFLDKYLSPICVAAEKNSIETISIPILEKSSIKNDKIRNKFINSITKIHKKYKNLNFTFEPEDLTCAEIKELLYCSENFTFTYDTGNITSNYNNHEEIIEHLFEKIQNVHIKDRTFEGKTVFPNHGNTDFNLIFNRLKLKNYNKIFTLQLARFLNGFEKETIKFYKKLFEEIYKNA
jgi:hypothetical protein